jgi:hypothetical protein
MAWKEVFEAPSTISIIRKDTSSPWRALFLDCTLEAYTTKLGESCLVLKPDGVVIDDGTSFEKPHLLSESEAKFPAWLRPLVPLFGDSQFFISNPELHRFTVRVNDCVVPVQRLKFGGYGDSRHTVSFCVPTSHASCFKEGVNVGISVNPTPAGTAWCATFMSCSVYDRVTKHDQVFVMLQPSSVWCLGEEVYCA